MIWSGDGSIALSSTHRRNRSVPGAQGAASVTSEFVTLVIPFVLGTMGFDEGPAPTGINESTAVKSAPSRL